MTNGLNFAVAHEIAHSLYVMRQYTLQMWTDYLARTGDLPLEQKRMEYHLSPEFRANEERTNTVARALAQAFNLPDIEPDPTYGYEIR